MHYDRTIIGYHGCDAAVAERLLQGRATFQESFNDYDWLGRGIYFWEFGADRAWRWAYDRAQRGRIAEPAVVGAVLQLGECFDLLDTQFTQALSDAYPTFRRLMRATGTEIPRNTGRTTDRLLRRRDCAVLNWYLKESEARGGVRFDSVRGVFVEGGAVFSGSKIASQSHVQVAIRNPRCIVGVFRPTYCPSP